MLRSFLVFGLFAALAVSLPAQEQGADGAAKNVGRHQSYLLVATEKSVEDDLQKAVLFESQKDWGSAVEIYHRLITQFPNRVVPQGDGKYVGVKEHCEQILRSDPPERLKAYREKFDAAAGRDIEAALDSGRPGALFEAAHRFSLTGHGEEILGKAGDLAFEDGRFQEAMYFWGRLIRLYPDSERIKSLAPKYALIARRSPGYTHGLSTLMQFVSSRGLGRQEIVVNQKKLTLEDYLKEVMGSLPPLMAGEYRSFKDYFYPRPYEGSAAVRLWRWEVPYKESSDVKDYHGVKWIDLELMNWKLIAPILPAAEENFLAVRFHDTMWVLQPRLGQVLRTFSVKSQVSSSWTRASGAFQNVTLHQGIPYTPMWKGYAKRIGQWWAEKKGGIYTAPYFYPVQSLCGYSPDLDRKVLTVEGGQWNFKIAPEVTDEHLFVAAEFRGNDDALPECRVACMDRESGRILWNTFLCTNTGRQTKSTGLQKGEAVPQTLGLYGDALVVSTNAGLIAALDTGTGDIRWMVTYPSLEPSQYKNMILMPPLVDRGTIAVFPLDSQHVLGVDVATGAVKWQYDMKRKGLCEGIAGGRVVVWDDQKVVFMDLETGKPAAEWSPPSGQTLEPVGKGALSAEAVYLPTAEGVWSVPLGDPKKAVLQDWPDPKVDPGTLMLLSTGMLSVSKTHLNMLVSREKFEELQRKKEKK